MGDLQRRATLIDELSQHPTLNEEEVGLLHLARCNVARFSQPMLLGEEAEARRVFDELGFRLDRVKRRIDTATAIRQ